MLRALSKQSFTSNSLLTARLFNTTAATFSGQNKNKNNNNNEMPPKKDAHDLSEGDEVSWKWGSGNPKGEVKDVVDGKATVTTKRGNEISKDGDEENPAVVLNTGQSDAVKRASEINNVKP